jgi:hypothetical protein
MSSSAMQLMNVLKTRFGLTVSFNAGAELLYALRFNPTFLFGVVVVLDNNTDFGTANHNKTVIYSPSYVGFN